MSNWQERTNDGGMSWSEAGNSTEENKDNTWLQMWYCGWNRVHVYMRVKYKGGVWWFKRKMVYFGVRSPPPRYKSGTFLLTSAIVYNTTQLFVESRAAWREQREAKLLSFILFRPQSTPNLLQTDWKCLVERKTTSFWSSRWRSTPKKWTRWWRKSARRCSSTTIAAATTKKPCLCHVSTGLHRARQPWEAVNRRVWWVAAPGRWCRRQTAAAWGSEAGDTEAAAGRVRTTSPDLATKNGTKSSPGTRNGWAWRTTTRIGFSRS